MTKCVHFNNFRCYIRFPFNIQLITIKTAKMKNLMLVLSLASCALVAGCGGGGTGAPQVSLSPTVSIDPNMTVPFQTAIANLVNNGLSANFSVSGWVDNSTPANPVPHTLITGSGNLALGTPTVSTFNKVSALKSTEVVTGSTTANGQTTPFSSTTTIFYSPSNYTTVGTVAGGKTMAISPYALPATVKAGSTGSFGNGTDGQFMPTTSTQDYVVTSDSATSLLVTLVQTTDSGAAGITKAQTVYRINTSGNISLASITTQRIFLGAVYENLVFTF